jgi:hypothetical protein
MTKLRIFESLTVQGFEVAFTNILEVVIIVLMTKKSISASKNPK